MSNNATKYYNKRFHNIVWYPLSGDQYAVNIIVLMQSYNNRDIFDHLKNENLVFKRGQETQDSAIEKLYFYGSSIILKSFL